MDKYGQDAHIHIGTSPFTKSTATTITSKTKLIGKQYFGIFVVFWKIVVDANCVAMRCDAVHWMLLPLSRAWFE